MFPVETFRDALAAVAKALTSRGIRFHLTGGIVSALYAEPRFTQDADIVVDRAALQAHLEPVLNEWQSRNFYFNRAGIVDAVTQGRPFQILESQETLKIDLYPRELVAGELSRSINVEVFAGLMLPVVSRPDLAVAKLIWISKGSHKSRRDLRQLLARASTTELTAVRTEAAHRSLETLLNEVLAESDEIPE